MIPNARAQGRVAAWAYRNGWNNIRTTPEQKTTVSMAVAPRNATR